MRRFLLIALSCLILSSCSGVPLKVPELANIPTQRGEYFTLIYFVGTERSDIRRAVVLDIEGDGYEIKPDVEAFQYEILQTIDVGEALYEAEIFFRHEGNKGFKRSAILTPGGDVVGYELRPIFDLEFMGVEDLMDLSYRLNKKTKVVSVKIKVRASIKRLVY